ncbi:hypothetical protein C0995_008055, partial [Termitomyces sp. Mi166
MGDKEKRELDRVPDDLRVVDDHVYAADGMCEVDGGSGLKGKEIDDESSGCEALCQKE